MIINIIKITSTKTDFIFYDITDKPIPHYFLDIRKKVLTGRYICDSKNVILYDDAKISLINMFEVDNELTFINNKTMLFRKHITLNENLDNVIDEFNQNIGVVDKRTYDKNIYENCKEYRKEYYDKYYQKNKELIKEKNMLLKDKDKEKYKEYQHEYHKIRYERDKEKIKEKSVLYYNNNKEKMKEKSLLQYYKNKIN